MDSISWPTKTTHEVNIGTMRKYQKLQMVLPTFSQLKVINGVKTFSTLLSSSCSAFFIQNVYQNFPTIIFALLHGRH